MSSKLSAAVLLVMALTGTASYAATDAKQDTVVIVPPAAPVTVEKSTGTKPSPVGQPVSDYKPRIKIKPAPAPPPPK